MEVSEREVQFLKYCLKHMNSSRSLNLIESKVEIEKTFGSISPEPLTTLKKKGLVDVYLGGKLTVHPAAEKAVKNHTVKTVKRIIFPVCKWIMGIVSAVVIAFLIYCFGLQ